MESGDEHSSFTAVQAAKKFVVRARFFVPLFTAVQAAKKYIQGGRGASPCSLPYRQLRKTSGYCAGAVLPFTAVQAAKKKSASQQAHRGVFTAVQAAKKTHAEDTAQDHTFTAVQAAKKTRLMVLQSPLDVHCRTGS